MVSQTTTIAGGVAHEVPDDLEKEMPQMDSAPSYLEIADFIASGTTPESVAAFRPTQAAIQRVEELTARNRDGILSGDEQAELDDYLQLEHLLILVKARARQKLHLAS